MATQLEVYNLALTFIGSRRLANTSEDRAPRHALDAVYTEVVGYCLSRGVWDFAMLHSSLSSASLPTPNFGYSNAFTKPTGIIHPYAFYNAVNTNDPYFDVADNGSVFLAQSGTLYLSHTSNNATTAGGNLGRWTAPFTKFAAAELASRVCFRLTRNIALTDRLVKMTDKFMAEALVINGVVGNIGITPWNALYRRVTHAGADVEQANPFVLGNSSEEEES